MKPSSGFSWRRASGLYYAPGRLTVATSRITAVGTRDTRVETVDVAEDELGGVVEELRARGRLPGHVFCALDPRLVFCVTLRLSEDDRKRGAVELLKEHVGPMDAEVTTGLMALKVPGGSHAVYACQRKLAADLLAGLDDVRESGRRCLPVVLPLLPLLRKAVAPRRRWKTWVALVPGEDFGLALLVHGAQVVGTRLFACREHAFDVSAAEAALHGLRTHARDDLRLARIDAVVVTADAAQSAESAARELESRLDGLLDVPVTASAQPLRLDAATLAEALALAALQGGPQAMDLFDELTTVTSRWEHVPARALSGVAALALVGAGLLAWQAAGMEGKAAEVKARAKQDAKQAGVTLKEVGEASKALKKEVQLAEAFAVKRLFWEDFLREIPAILPETMYMTRLDGRNGMRWSDRSKAETKLTITAEIPLERIEGTPPEVGAFTDAIKASELFLDKLPRNRSSTVRFQAGVTNSKAKLTLLCTPR